MLHWCAGAGWPGEEGCRVPAGAGLPHPLGQHGGPLPDHMTHYQLQLWVDGLWKWVRACDSGLHPTKMSAKHGNCGPV